MGSTGYDRITTLHRNMIRKSLLEDVIHPVISYRMNRLFSSSYTPTRCPYETSALNSNTRNSLFSGHIIIGSSGYDNGNLFLLRVDGTTTVQYLTSCYVSKNKEPPNNNNKSKIGIHIHRGRPLSVCLSVSVSVSVCVRVCVCDSLIVQSKIHHLLSFTVVIHRHNSRAQTLDIIFIDDTGPAVS